MNALELLQENPDAAKIIKEYYVELMLNSLDEADLPEHFKEFLKDQGIDDEKVAQMMEANARNVYDVLDENGFVISMNWDKATNTFTSHINDSSIRMGANSRKQAENNAVTLAIQLLQKKINPQPSAELYED